MSYEWISFKEMFEKFNSFYDEQIRANFKEVEELAEKKVMLTNVLYLAITFKDTQGNYYSLLPNHQRSTPDKEHIVLKTGAIYDTDDCEVIATFDRPRYTQSS